MQVKRSTWKEGGTAFARALTAWSAACGQLHTVQELRAAINRVYDRVGNKSLKIDFIAIPPPSDPRIIQSRKIAQAFMPIPMLGDGTIVRFVVTRHQPEKPLDG